MNINHVTKAIQQSDLIVAHDKKIEDLVTLPIKCMVYDSYWSEKSNVAIWIWDAFNWGASTTNWNSVYNSFRIKGVRGGTES